MTTKDKAHEIEKIRFAVRAKTRRLGEAIQASDGEVEDHVRRERGDWVLKGLKAGLTENELRDMCRDI
jgi:hypothetical protein